MDFFKHTFNEDTWNVYLIDDDDHHISDGDADAEVVFSLKEIYFRRSALTESIVRHELWHVYFGYCYLSDVPELTANQVEEISASLFEDKGERIIKLASEIYQKLVVLKDQK